MAIVFIEGFDKYGPSAASLTTALTAAEVTWLTTAMSGEWAVGTPAATGGIFVGPPLSSNGGSVCILGGTPVNVTNGITKTLPASYTKAIGGIRFQVTAAGGFPSGAQYIQFQAGSTFRCGIGFTNAGGIVVVDQTFAVIATATGKWTVGSTHYLEWNITLGAGGTYTIYLDGVQILTGSGSLGAAGNYDTMLVWSPNTGSAAGNSMAFDDMYVDDGTGAPLLTNPVVYTSFPTSDSAVAFTVGASIMGDANASGTATNAPGANTLFLRKFTALAGTLNGVSIVPEATSAGANFKAVLYSDNAGVPNSLLATGAQATGTTSGTVLTSNFSVGQTLTGGTSYWIGFITDTSVALLVSNTSNSGLSVANTYASGAPATAPAMTAGASWTMWGNMSGVTGNWKETSVQAPNGVWGDYSYVTSNVLNAEDLEGFAALPVTPSAVYAVSLKGYMKDAAVGARTVTLNTK